MRKSYRLEWVLCFLIVGALGCSSSNRAGMSGMDAGGEQDQGSGDGDSTSGDGDTGGDGDSTSGDGDTGGDGDADAGDGALGSLPGDWEIPDELKLCGDRACACANGVDDDGDGEIDGFDAECTGANDDDEGSFATGIPGDNKDEKWQDCFFDGNSGAGDDGCRYHAECLTGEREQDSADCTVTTACVDFCLARTPNGCDCFGCCTFTTDQGASVSVVIRDGCSEEDLDSCDKCEPTEGLCNNPCGECELCPGKTLDDLPETCFDTTGGDGDGSSGDGDGDGDGDSSVPPFTCDGGQQPCFDTSDCQSAEYCYQGCCLLSGPS